MIVHISTNPNSSVVRVKRGSTRYSAFGALPEIRGCFHMGSI